MTAEELIQKFNKEYGNQSIERPWPNFYEVDHETYANCCQFVFDNKNIFNDYAAMTGRENVQYFTIALGANKGLLFKNVELILKSRSMM